MVLIGVVEAGFVVVVGEDVGLGFNLSMSGYIYIYIYKMVYEEYVLIYTAI